MDAIRGIIDTNISTTYRQRSDQPERTMGSHLLTPHNSCGSRSEDTENSCTEIPSSTGTVGSVVHSVPCQPLLPGDWYIWIFAGMVLRLPADRNGRRAHARRTYYHIDQVGTA